MFRFLFPQMFEEGTGHRGCYAKKTLSGYVLKKYLIFSRFEKFFPKSYGKRHCT